MPLYDYGCPECDNVMEVFHKMAEKVRMVCINCRVPYQKHMSDGFVKRPDATWVKDINGVINDLEYVNNGRQERIETREQARKAINYVYRDKHPAVQRLRQRYLERY